MKVKYVQDYADPSVAPGYVYRAGTVAEHDDTTGAARIALGVCEAVDNDARARKNPPQADLEFHCIPPVTADAAIEGPTDAGERPTRKTLGFKA